MKKQFLTLSFLLLISTIVSANCPCEMTVKVEYPGTNISTQEDTYPCSSLYGDIQSQHTIVSGSKITFKYCTLGVECLDPTNPYYPGIQPNNFPVYSISSSDPQGGSISYQSLGSTLLGNIVCPAWENNDSYIYTAPTSYDNTIESVKFNLVGSGGTIEFDFVYLDLYSYDELTMEEELLETIISDTDPDGNPFEYDVVADGTKVMLFDFEQGNLEIRNAGSAELYGALTSNGLNGFYYTTPEKYTSNTSNIYLDWSPSNSSQAAISIKLNIKPVPVMLIHGLASNGVVWNDLKGNLINQGWENEHIATPSYDNDISFLISAGTINSEINNWVNQLKGDDLFFNKINLVGHSMGGLVSRQYVKNNGGDRIQKIITLNTPHSGSELANFVLGNAFGSGLANIIFNTIADDFSIYNGAMNSLRVNSDEILSLNSSSGTNGIKVHAVTSVFELCDYLVPSLNVANKANNRLRIFTGITSRFLGFAYYAAAGSCAFKNYVLPPPNDGIVRQVSQNGGLAGSSVQNYSGILGTHHIRSTKNTSIVNTHIPNLLKESANNNQFASGFSPITIPPPTLINNDINDSPIASSGIDIVVENINHLDTLYTSFFPSIDIVGTDSVSGIMVGYYFVELDTVVFDSVFSSTHTFTIPEFQGYEGELIISTMGTNGDGEIDYHGFVTFVTLGNPPAPDVPLLISPINESENLSISQNLSWGNTVYAESYQMQISTDNNFSTLELDTLGVTSTNLTVDNLLFDTEYFWRVRSSNASSNSDWSTVWSFKTIIAPPPPPQLLLPIDGSIDTDIAISLEWEVNSNIDSYSLQLSLDNSFVSLVVDTVGVLNNELSISNLQNGTTYFWRVKGVNLNGESDWSPTWDFSTIINAPDIPELLLPIDNSEDLPLNLVVQWNSIQDAASYQLQVAKVNIFSNPIIDEQNITDVQFNLNGLENDSTYYWRVKAYNVGGESDWSPVWSFTIIIGAPSSPQLVLPINNAIDISPDLSVEWNMVQDADSYQLQVSQDENFSNLVTDEQGITNLQFNLNGLQNDSTYYWRVKAFNVGGESNWSSAWNFTVEDVMDAIDEKFSNKIQVFPNPSDWILSVFIPEYESTELIIYNSVGQKVFEKNVANNQIEIDVSQFPSGIYMIQVQTKEKIGIKKLIIK